MDYAAANIAGSFAGAEHAARVRAVERRERSKRPRELPGAGNEGDQFDQNAPVEEVETGGERAKDATDHRVDAVYENPLHAAHHHKHPAQENAPADDRGGHIDLAG